MKGERAGAVSILVALSCPGPLDARHMPADTAGQEVAANGGRRHTASQQPEEAPMLVDWLRLLAHNCLIAISASPANRADLHPSECRGL